MSLKKLTTEVNRTLLLPRIQTTSFLDSPFDCLQLKSDNTNLTGELACSGGNCEIDVDLKTIAGWSKKINIEDPLIKVAQALL